ncbi:MAG: glycosyltransferase family 2 protein [Actinomycetota bacterium]|nr:glycosyltransferase family 2 protein [Actinomycetota bacterium]
MSSSLARPTLSFVLPVFNEGTGLVELHARLCAVMDALDMPSEAILVDDGSTDSSFDVMRGIRAADDRFKLVQLSRNFGHQAAITAGLDLAQGDAAVIMDSDLQHPPEIVPQLIARWREGFDIVNAERTTRTGETRFKRLSARAFYWILGKLAQVPMQPNVGDFRLVDRKALDAFKAMRENTRYLRGMFSWVGFRQTNVPYEYHDRHAGAPKYNLARMVRLGVDGIASFSQVPLQVALHVGFVVAVLSFVAGVGDLIAKIVGANTVPGWLSVAITVSFLGGMQLLILGVMGTYMGRMYEEVKLRPLYIVRQLDGIEAPTTPGTRTVVVSVPLD